MTTNATLNAELREGTGKGVARKLRSQGRLPAVVYGDKQEALALTVDAHETELLFQRISVDNTIVSLQIEGSKKPIDTLVREVQVHPFKPQVMHVDFLRIRAGVALDVVIPIHVTGTALGVKLNGGSVEQILHELEVRCIPSKIPEEFTLDISDLDIGDALHVSDIDLGEGVEIHGEATRTVVTISAPRVAEVDEEAEEDGEAAQPEVIGEADSDEG